MLPAPTMAICRGTFGSVLKVDILTLPILTLR
jgi:hypothetical protein